MRNVLLAALALFVTALALDRMTATAATSRAEQAAARVRPQLERELSAAGLRFGAPVFVRIFKAERVLEIFVDDGERFRLFKSFPICTYSGELGPKLKQGDGQAPEGFYDVTSRRLNPASRFHLAFNLGYPNAYDRHHGRTGDFLMVHGNCVSVGCYAMTDAGIEPIYVLVEAALRGGQKAVPVHAFPFRMTEARRGEIESSRWRAFWENLRDGYEWFEREGKPPRVSVANGVYAFENG